MTEVTKDISFHAIPFIHYIIFIGRKTDIVLLYIKLLANKIINMKKVFPLLFLFGCYYDDSCPRDAQLKSIQIQINNEVQLIKTLRQNPQPYSDDVVAELETEEDNLSLLLIDKAILEVSPCK